MTTLSAEIQAFREQFVANVPEEVLQTLLGETEKLVATGIAERALGVGDQFPDGELSDVHGRSVALGELLRNGPTIINFYRGEWCPYCNLEINAFQRLLPEVKSRGAQMVAISPQTPDKSLTVEEKHALEFPVLSDVGNKLARDLGLVFNLPEALKVAYTNFGFPLPDYNGDESWTLPIPATYVIDKTGLITYAFVDADYSQRAEPQEVLDSI
ncbi:MAG: AhpC/TSA family protein [Porticoccaceae bacterium]|nr:AhpC/TSA family protein [Porticoccaceae bacterium]